MCESLVAHFEVQMRPFLGQKWMASFTIKRIFVGLDCLRVGALAFSISCMVRDLMLLVAYF